MASIKQKLAAERLRCAQVCHEKFMEYNQKSCSGDINDEFEYGLMSNVAYELREAILQLGENDG